jgi:predicted DNA-binding protein with PD1-like motif
MNPWFYKPDKMFLARLPHDGDLLLSIKNVFKESGIQMGFFTAIGAVKTTHVAFYDQAAKIYTDFIIDEPAEILSCVGNVSEVDGGMSVHAHITLGLKDGTAKGGHLLEGTVIFASELFGVALEGQRLERRFDEITGLKLWSS